MSELLGLGSLLLIALVVLALLLTGMLVFEARRPSRRTAAYAVARGLAVDPEELGLAFEEWELDRPCGARLPVWEIDLGPSGQGLTAVFLHGWGQSRIDSLARVEPWRALVDRIVLYDLRGHGEAAGGPSRLGDGETEDLLALLERAGSGPVLLIGSSMGAVIAIRAAATGVADVAGIVAYGPYAEFHPSLRGRIAASGFPTRPFTDLAMAWWRLVGLRPPGVESAAASLTCPLLVVHGTDDQVCPRWHAERIVAATPQAELLEIEGAGHADAHRHDDHDEAIAAFVRGLAPLRELSPS